MDLSFLKELKKLSSERILVEPRQCRKFHRRSGAIETLRSLYRHSLVLLTDLYQLTMAFGYWKSRVAEREAVFHLFFRENPFGGSFAVAGGLSDVVELLSEFRFDDGDIEYLSGLAGNDARALFEPEFLEYLRTLSLTCDIDAVPEGTVVFAPEPLVRIQGPLLQCQILETALLNIINFQTLIATKAARVCLAARGDAVLEFGLRRAQGIDGGLAASRAAYLGGCTATSNVLAGKLFGIPVKGTHAHSWIMCFDDELEAFQSYAKTMPNNCVFLVDTFDTLRGVRKAAQIGRWLREQGHEMIGIRLDSGDLTSLSIEARKILDEAGFAKSVIIASNDLDEHLIEELKQQGAMISIWGVGTRLATAYDQPALGGVYKLSAVRNESHNWQYKVKLSEQVIKVSNPGIQQIRRYRNAERFLADVIYDVGNPPPEDGSFVELMDHTPRPIPSGTTFDDLLVPVMRQGGIVYDAPLLSLSRDRCQLELDSLTESVKQLKNAQPYPVGLESTLHQLKTNLIEQSRGDPQSFSVSS